MPSIMSIFPVFPAVLGFAALLATASILALEVFLAYGFWPSTSPARIIAVIASVAQAIVLALIITTLVKHVRGRNDYRPRDFRNVWFALDLIASVLASAVSVALLILIGKARVLPNNTSNIPLTNLLIGSAIVLGFAFTAQLLFVVTYFVLHQMPDSDQAVSLHTNDEGRLSPPFSMRMKSVPYDRTKPALSRTRSNERDSSEYPSRPGTSGGRSAAETITSFSGSVSSVVRPMGSRTRLLSSSSKSGQRLNSFDSSAYRDRYSVPEDGFDSWDTSSVDPHNRQIVLETSSPIRPRFLLETIPASPANSRSPSPGCPLDLEPKKRGQRNRSPVHRAHQERTYMPSESELHIHPLFRTDSPGPPPAATPGTVVVAAPNAGQFITGTSVMQMRSGSLAHSPGLLSRQESYETFRKTPSPNSDRLQPEVVDGGERKMTPPIPDWILNPEPRPSFAGYRRNDRRNE
ncbi:hypothetical protein F5Y14DRAFT_16237 [Nemania sp. NC0429]|nr:hypothetical protein F5Y14DRAFT_16237 [Nemania sp. NC0429]